MDHIRTPDCNVTLKGDGKNVHDLPAMYQDGIWYTFWQPTAKELELLKKGGTICLSVSSGSFPPVRLTVE